jgi:hypothetical protein
VIVGDAVAVTVRVEVGVRVAAGVPVAVALPVAVADGHPVTDTEALAVLLFSLDSMMLFPKSILAVFGLMAPQLAIPTTIVIVSVCPAVSEPPKQVTTWFVVVCWQLNPPPVTEALMKLTPPGRMSCTPMFDAEPVPVAPTTIVKVT